MNRANQTAPQFYRNRARCILCESPALSGLKYCAPHYNRAQHQTLAEKIAEQREAEANRSIERRLQRLGYGHRRLDNSANTGKHEVFRLKDGEVIGQYRAHEAIEAARADYYGPFLPKAMPGQEMTDEEIDAQCALVSACADACEYMTEQREQERWPANR